VAGGGTGLDFAHFLKFLVMISYHALSKTNAYSSMYSTIEVSFTFFVGKYFFFRLVHSCYFSFSCSGKSGRNALQMGSR
jgi:hypothetical protein